MFIGEPHDPSQTSGKQMLRVGARLQLVQWQFLAVFLTMPSILDWLKVMCAQTHTHRHSSSNPEPEVGIELIACTTPSEKKKCPC